MKDVAKDLRENKIAPTNGEKKRSILYSTVRTKLYKKKTKIRLRVILEINDLYILIMDCIFNSQLFGTKLSVRVL